jgi:UTP--glucose-1-phosphate uridylyltransferase/phosphoglucomutase
MPEADISPAAGLPSLAALDQPSAPTGATSAATLLAKTAVLKLNGGLGTSMGLEKAKSLLEVKNGHTFLDLIALQVKSLRAQFAPSKVRFVLMDSFATSEDTRALLKERHPELEKEEGWELLQNKSPKVDKETLAPASWPRHAELEWCPPGHGDIYPSLLGSGMLDKLLSEGVEYLFVSNSDNLGATLDLALLRHFSQAASGSQAQAFMMEVCERTAADKKGGHLAVRKSDGKFVLRESAMCPGEFFEGFFFFFRAGGAGVSSSRARGAHQKKPQNPNLPQTNKTNKQTPTNLLLRTSPSTATSTPTTCGCTSLPSKKSSSSKGGCCRCR